MSDVKTIEAQIATLITTITDLAKALTMALQAKSPVIEPEAAIHEERTRSDHNARRFCASGDAAVTPIENLLGCGRPVRTEADIRREKDKDAYIMYLEAKLEAREEEIKAVRFQRDTYQVNYEKLMEDRK
jgi:hypothetical protein